LFNPDPKYKSQLLAKTCRDVAQQGENKGQWKERTEQANNTDFSFFLNFSLIFPKGTRGNQTFLFFHYLFIIFSEQGQKRCNHKNWHLQLRWDVVYRNIARSLKNVQKL
jgi:hypothetical protein